MDILDILMAMSSSGAKEARQAAAAANEAAEAATDAALAANSAADAAEQVIADIYHDKQLIWSVDETDNHVVLTYYEEETEE